MDGKKDIVYENCKTMLKKFDEMNIKYTYSEYSVVIHGQCGENNLYMFAPLFM